jgi:pyrimidine and pyridine-specific 5'-nucleotidase
MYNSSTNLLGDDSYQNCKKAQELGWTVAHLVEDDIQPPKTPACKYQIRHLNDLRTTFPQFFKTDSPETS